jgi:2'-5' RNA ligase
MFVAVWPDTPIAQNLSALGLRRMSGLSPVRTEHWHVTLRFLGDAPEDMVPTLIDALEAARKTQPIHCKVGPSTAWFGRGRVLPVPVAGLDGAAGAVREATASVVASDDLPFVGHLTLARARDLNATTRNALTGIRCAATLAVDSSELVASHLSQVEPRYMTLARFPATRSREPGRRGGVTKGR